MSLLVCPNCKVEMKSINREDIEIDVCTNCYGIWLDKGELEKLITVAKTQYESEKLDKKTKSNRRFWFNIFNIFD